MLPVQLLLSVRKWMTGSKTYMKPWKTDHTKLWIQRYFTNWASWFKSCLLGNIAATNLFVYFILKEMSTGASCIKVNIQSLLFLYWPLTNLTHFCLSYLPVCFTAETPGFTLISWKNCKVKRGRLKASHLTKLISFFSPCQIISKPFRSLDFVTAEVSLCSITWFWVNLFVVLCVFVFVLFPQQESKLRSFSDPSSNSMDNKINKSKVCNSSIAFVHLSKSHSFLNVPWMLCCY